MQLIRTINWCQAGVLFWRGAPGVFFGLHQDGLLRLRLPPVWFIWGWSPLLSVDLPPLLKNKKKQSHCWRCLCQSEVGFLGWWLQLGNCRYVKISQLFRGVQKYWYVGDIATFGMQILLTQNSRSLRAGSLVISLSVSHPLGRKVFMGYFKNIP